MEFLKFDLRVDEDQLNELDPFMMREWLDHAPKKSSLIHLINIINFLTKEQSTLLLTTMLVKSKQQFHKNLKRQYT